MNLLSLKLVLALPSLFTATFSQFGNPTGPNIDIKPNISAPTEVTGTEGNYTIADNKDSVSSDITYTTPMTGRLTLPSGRNYTYSATVDVYRGRNIIRTIQGDVTGGGSHMHASLMTLSDATKIVVTFTIKDSASTKSDTKEYAVVH